MTTAVHTDTQILHSAAVVDFIGWVRTLVENGHLEDAAELWDSVAEVVHMPVPESPLRERVGLPATHAADSMLCGGLHPLPRATRGVPLSVAGGVVTPLLRGATGHVALRCLDGPWREAGAHGHHAGGGLCFGLLPPRSYAGGVGWDGVPGCGSTWLCPYQHRLRMFQRAMAEWLQFVVDYPDLHIPASCALCGSLTRHLCVGCLVSFCPTCTLDRADPLCCAEALASGDMRLEMPALRFGENTGRIIQHLVRQNMPLVQRRP